MINLPRVDQAIQFLAYVRRRSPNPSISADAGHRFQAQRHSRWAASVTADDVRQEIRADLGLPGDLLLGGSFFYRLHGQRCRGRAEKCQLKSGNFLIQSAVFASKIDLLINK
jgi:hypothetical protein